MSFSRRDKITENFYWYEAFTTSHHDLQQFLPEKCTYLIANQITHLANLLENLREDLGNKAIHPTSWFRDEDLNTRVGGSATSQHTTGEAVDFVAEAGSWEAFFALDNYDIGQRIIYLNSADRATRVHVSIPPRDGRALERSMVKYDGEPLITWKAFVESERGSRIFNALPPATKVNSGLQYLMPEPVEPPAPVRTTAEPLFVLSLLRRIFRALGATT